MKVIDRLKAKRIPTRKSLLSEMLCHFFPARYPLWNSKIVDWLNWSEFTPARGTTQGERYLAVARYLRAALAAEPDYPARDLAELDRLIWETVAQSEAS